MSVRKIVPAIVTAVILTTVPALGAGAAKTAATTIPANAASAVADPARPAEDTARDANRKPAEMIVFAGVKPGAVVVDLVPGRGYFTRVFAKAVGPSGHVYAYFPSELDGMLKGKPPSVTGVTNDGANYGNVTLIHAPVAKFVTPQLVDVVWTSQNYHDLHDSFFGPQDLSVVNKAIYNSLKPGGYYIVLDHVAEKGSGLRDTDTLHRIDPAIVKKQVVAAGFVFDGESDVLRNPADDHKQAVFDKSIRGRTDQFVYRFRKPGG
jgi:predicted methyltransferase